MWDELCFGFFLRCIFEYLYPYMDGFLGAFAHNNCATEEPGAEHITRVLLTLLWVHLTINDRCTGNPRAQAHGSTWLLQASCTAWFFNRRARAVSWACRALSEGRSQTTRQPQASVPRSRKRCQGQGMPFRQA